MGIHHHVSERKQRNIFQHLGPLSVHGAPDQSGATRDVCSLFS
ncbi:hypothetical protein BN2364_2736 [Alloalcanivorax xenomutans]|nr:hypothetical protein BN2364_2736 [Alloalcanivorax xenomutans]